MKVGGVGFFLATGTAGKFKKGSADAAPKAPFRSVFKACVDYLEADGDLEHMTATDEEATAEEEPQRLRRNVMGLEAHLTRGQASKRGQPSTGLRAFILRRRTRRGLRGRRGR